MRGRMAYPPERRTGKHRAASTARSLPAQRTWTDELSDIERQEAAELAAGYVVRRYAADGKTPLYVRYDPADSEERRAFIVSELQAILDHCEAERLDQWAALLADEIEHAQTCDLDHDTAPVLELTP